MRIVSECRNVVDVFRVRKRGFQCTGKKILVHDANPAQDNNGNDEKHNGFGSATVCLASNTGIDRRPAIGKGLVGGGGRPPFVFV